MARRSLRVAYFVTCAAIALACVWFAVQVWQAFQQLALARFVFLVAASFFFALTGISVLRGGKLSSWLAGISGTVLCLYAIAVVLMGWEDVGGARGAIPIALGTGLVGAVGIAIGIGRRARPGEAA